MVLNGDIDSVVFSYHCHLAEKSSFFMCNDMDTLQECSCSSHCSTTFLLPHSKTWYLTDQVHIIITHSICLQWGLLLGELGWSGTAVERQRMLLQVSSMRAEIQCGDRGAKLAFTIMAFRLLRPCVNRLETACAQQPHLSQDGPFSQPYFEV